MAKETSILFSTLMVQQIRALVKDMTRREVKNSHLLGLLADKNCTLDYLSSLDFCPYGEVGDILWVREEHYCWGFWVRDGLTKKGREKWKFVATGKEVLFSDNPPSSFRISRSKEEPGKCFWHKRLGRFMPRKYCRILLEITAKRIEKVQAISEEDAKREGVPERCYEDTEGNFIVPDKATEKVLGPCGTYKDGFKALWLMINGAKSWNKNIYVWVVTFKIKKKK